MNWQLTKMKFKQITKTNLIVKTNNKIINKKNRNKLNNSKLKLKINKLIFNQYLITIQIKTNQIIIIKEQYNIKINKY